MSQPIAEIDPFDNAFTEDRHRALAEMRRRSPVARTESGAWFVTSHAGVLEGLRNVDHFVGSFGDTGNAPPDDQSVAAIPEPRHGKVRKVINSVLAYHHASQAEPFVRKLAAELMDQALAPPGGDEVDLVECYTRRIPSAVIAYVLGVPATDYDQFAIWSDEVLEYQGTSDAEHTGMGDVHPEFAAYVDAQIAQRLASSDPPEDLISRLLFTTVDGERLSPRMVRTQTMFLIIAGNETTRNLIGNCFHRLALDADLYASLGAGPARIPELIEESLRIDSPVQLLARTCTKPIRLQGVPVAEGDRVLYSIAAANRDERCFDAPDEFRPGRANARDHLGFGAGPHICPGAYLARMETRVALETFLERVPRLALSADYTWDPNPVFWALGPRSLRVRIGH